MNPNSPELAYLIATERQQELIAMAEAPSAPALRGLVERLRSSLAR